jgi:hypothetical protein
MRELGPAPKFSIDQERLKDKESRKLHHLNVCKLITCKLNAYLNLYFRKLIKREQMISKST